MTSRSVEPWREIGFAQTDGVLVRIPADVAASAGVVAWTFAPLETGGLLLGRYTAGRSVLTVTAALPPPRDSMHGRTDFYRGTEGLTDQIAAARATNADVFVVGEWHTHPGGASTPSATDVWGMRRFARRGLFGCRSPVLLILCGDLGPSAPWGATVFRRWTQPAMLVRAW